MISNIPDNQSLTHIIGTSAPEFFTNIMGTFVTKTDLGIGTIVGRYVICQSFSVNRPLICNVF